jgi:type I restriction enzyme S subunit
MELTKTNAALSKSKGYKSTEIGLIPEDWDVVRFNEIGEAIIGLTYSPSDISESGKLVHRSSNIQNNRLSYLDNVFVSCSVPDKLILQKGDILICVRNGSRELIGKSAIIDGASIGETFGAFMSVFRTKSYSPLIYQFVLSEIVQKQINASLGATINQITNKTLNEFIIPLPPTLTEQKAIATALSDVDALISSLEKLIAKKKAIKQGAMQELLTPPHKGGKRLPGFSGEWEETVFTKLCDLVHGHQFRTEDFNHNTEGIKVVKIGNVFQNLLKTQDCDTIAGNRIDEFQKYLIAQGDILMSLTGNIGRVVRVKTVSEPLLQNYRVGKFVPREWVDGEFLSIILGSNKTTTQLEQLSNSGAQANFGKQDFDKVQINIPKDIYEQKAIAQILTDMDSELVALEGKKEKYQQIKQGMMQELLTGKTRLV